MYCLPRHHHTLSSVIGRAIVPKRKKALQEEKWYRRYMSDDATECGLLQSSNERKSSCETAKEQPKSTLIVHWMRTFLISFSPIVKSISSKTGKGQLWEWLRARPNHRTLGRWSAIQQLKNNEKTQKTNVSNKSRDKWHFGKRRNTFVRK